MASSVASVGPGGDGRTHVFTNGRILMSEAELGVASDAPPPAFASTMVVSPNGRVAHVGSGPPPLSDNTTTTAGDAAAAVVHDLSSRDGDGAGPAVVLPGFVDGHMHLLLLGQSLSKADLGGCGTLGEIRAAIAAHAAANPAAPRILCKGWMHSMTGGEATAAMLVGVDGAAIEAGRGERPVFVDSKDLHSTWVNGAALAEMGLAGSTAATRPNPPGGEVHRSPVTGEPTGLLSEAAVLTLVWPHLASVATLSEKVEALRAAVGEYTRAGYTGAVDMAMDAHAWEAFVALREDHLAATGTPLPLRLAAYWLVTPAPTVEACLEQVAVAAELAKQYSAETSPDARVVGIKIITDGVVDACTAALARPYATGLPSPDPLWERDALHVVVRRADALGLQVALHAIGDAAVELAVGALAAAASDADPGGVGRRHRIEHLELTSPGSAARLASLGVTASVQPVHADPAILRAWHRLLSPGRCRALAFRYRDVALAGAALALGTDGPTAPWSPWGNAFVATTRRSARRGGASVDMREVAGEKEEGGEGGEPPAEDEGGEAGEFVMNRDQALPLAYALRAASFGAAYSVFDEARVGSLQPGKRADFVVVDWDVDAGPDGLLGARVRETWFDGRLVWKRED